ncbi:hypothetical protein [Enterococcus saccharolyticus]|uniref:Uncharacterized protein n=1 Tax=Enterococcus saccharolyticus subsp. saccharolyticus ATCC 43076 TaxID=1139996 RepID=S0N4V4_9ENTE|nr:hypothetical protein [Enterococcus saccharolyticus]EOT26349.1 hypothetical protein OMQ_02124 [Enterococcus saccharolyticus subsp. saccharolyticus ATCC 43076]EOT76309.1 hypothetical protein I572_02497 [Enterococcus saccharolyticus subsp. saccharolyticus ATCC 43076]
MVSMTKITSSENYQRYHISFSHAIGFTMAVYGRSVSKNSQIKLKSMTIQYV